MVRKIFIVFVVFVLIISTTLILPQKKVEAFAWGLAVPTGVTVGAGAYTTGALILGGLVGIAGYDIHSEEINAHALRVWESGTDVARDSLNTSIELAKSAGNALTSIDTGYSGWLESQIDSIAAYIANGQMVNDPNHPINAVGTNIPSTLRYEGGYGTDLVVETAIHPSNMNVNLFLGNTVNQHWFMINLRDRALNYNIRNQVFSIPVTEARWNSLVPTIAGLGSVKAMIAFLDTHFPGHQVTIGNTADNVYYQNTLNKLRENWTSMRDAGLVLPVNDAIPYSGGQALNYNPATDRYTFPSGEIFDGTPGDLTWSFPQPKIITDTLGVPRVAFPTRAEPIEGTSIGELTGTWTDVLTGEIITSEVDVPVVPKPPGEIDLSKPNLKLSFLPLMMTGELMKEKFPFSIPFDFLRQLKIFDVKPKAPVIKVNIPKYLQIEGTSIPMKFDIDLSFFDMVADWIRWGNIILFDIGLIFMIRRFMPE